MEEPLPRKSLSPFMAALKQATLNTFIQQQLACYVPERAKNPNSNKSFDLMSEILNFVGHPEQRTALLIGDSGGGKTLFGQYLIQTLWEAFDESKPTCQVPLWVNLATIENPGKDLLLKHLLHLRPLDEDNDELSLQWPVLCGRLLQTKSFFLVLDGADEISFAGNIYEANNFIEKRTKILTTCRTSALRVDVPTRRLFGFPSELTENETYEFPEFELVPFEKAQKLKYLQLYIQYYQQEPKWPETEFAGKLEELVDIDELTSNPYCLFLALEELPEAVARHAKETDRVQRIKLTRHYIYQRYVEKYFLRQKEKLVTTRNEEVIALINKFNEGRLPDAQISLIDLFKDYCQRLAQAMHERGMKQIRYKPESEITVKTLPEIIMEGSISPVAVPSSKQEPQDEYEWLKKFFDDNNNPGLAVIRSGCPIRQLRPGEWAFNHPSLLDYFIADHLFNSAILEAEIISGHNLSAGNLQDKPDILKFLVDLAKENEEFVKVLFQIIELAKYESQAWKASANAVTILNYAGIILTGKDFRRGRFGGIDDEKKEAWGADLSYCNLYGTDATDSDMRYVDIDNSDVSRAKLTNALMTGVTVRQRIPFKGPMSALSKDGAWFVSVKHKGNADNSDLVSLVDTSTFEIFGKLPIIGFIALKNVCLNPRYPQVCLFKDRASTDAPFFILFGKNQTLKLTAPGIMINSVLYRPDGKQLVVHYGEGLAFIDATNGKEIYKYEDAQWLSFFYSPSGRQLAVANQAHIIFINTINFQLVAKWKVDLLSYKMFYSLDETKLYLLIKNETKLFCIATGEEKLVSGKDIVITTSNKKTLTQFDLNKKVLSTWCEERGFCSVSLDIRGDLYGYCFSPNQRQLAIVEKEQISLWDVKEGCRENSTQICSSSSSVKICYSSDGKQLAIFDGTLQIWDVEKVECVRILGEASWSFPIVKLIFHPSLPLLFSEDYRQTAVWDTSKLKKKARVIKKQLALRALFISSEDGQYVLSNNSSAMTLDQLYKDQLLCLNYKKAVVNFCYSHDSKYLAVFFHNGTIRVYENQTHKEISYHSGEKVAGYRTSIIFRPDGHQIAYTYTEDTDLSKPNGDWKTDIGRRVGLWDILTGATFDLYQPGSDEHLSFLAYSPDGSRLVLITSKEKMLIFETRKRSLLKTFVHTDVSNIIAISFIDNNHLITIQENKKIFTTHTYTFSLWNIENFAITSLSSEVKDIETNQPLVLSNFKPHRSGKFLAVSSSLIVGVFDRHTIKRYVGVWNVAEKKWRTLIVMNTDYVYYWVGDEMKLRVLDTDGAQTIWKIGDSHKDTMPVWRSRPSYRLSKDHLEVTNCYGLNKNLLDLLHYTGNQNIPSSIIGTPNQTRKVEDVLKERNSQVYIREGFTRVNHSDGNFLINRAQWLVSLVRKRQPLRGGFSPLANRSAHVSLIIQGITEDNYSCVKEIHLFLDQSKSSLFQAIGTGLIQIRDKSPGDLESQAFTQQYIAKSRSVSKAVVMQLLANIEDDQKQRIDYLISGYSPGLLSRPAYNCMTWCEYHLQKVGIPIDGPERDLFCAFPTEHLPDPAQAPDNGCGLM